MAAAPGVETPIAPYLTMSDGAKAIDFATRAFAAGGSIRKIAGDDRRVPHAPLHFDGSAAMLSDHREELDGGCRTPQSRGGTPATIQLPVRNADCACECAVDAAAQVVMPLDDMSCGDRYGKLRGPSGHGRTVGASITRSKPRATTKPTLAHEARVADATAAASSEEAPTKRKAKTATNRRQPTRRRRAATVKAQWLGR